MIKIASVDDIAGIFTVNKLCLPIYYSVNDWLYMINTTSKFLTYIYKDKNIIMGYLLAEISSDRYHILSIAVIPNFRKLGIGKELLEALKKINENKKKIISLNVHVENKIAINFYKKNNFIISKELVNYYLGTNFSKNKNAYHMILSNDSLEELLTKN